MKNLLPPAPRPRCTFTEADAWQPVKNGWQPLHGSFLNLGYSVEWHDFEADQDLDWSASFHPGGVEICLNLDGHGTVRAGRREIEFAPRTAGFYVQGESGLKGVRHGGRRHQFMTIEFSDDFVARHVGPEDRGLHPCLQRVFRQRSGGAVSEVSRLTCEHHEWINALRHPPSNPASRRMWAHAKTLELASSMFFPQVATGELFCERVKRLNHERVQKVVAILKENLAQPPSLEEIGRRVGCSHYYLSRIFSEQFGCGIFQHLRALRLERAAELICRGEMKLTDVALEVGYSSPSHFTTAFRDAFGCCPGLYPLRVRAGRAKSQTAQG